MTQNPRPTRSEQREAARAKARELRERRAKGDMRRRILITGAVIISVVSVIVTVSWIVLNFSQDSQTNAENAKKVPANLSTQGGIIIGKDMGITTEAAAKASNHIVIYQDYQCPACQMFEAGNLSQIKTWVQNGYAVVEFHPISFLDGQSLNNYSSRAANAALCVVNSQPEKFFQVNTDLYYNQPKEGSAGPDNNGLKETLRGAGVSVNNEISECIEQNRYKVYVQNATQKAFSTPAVTGKDVVSSTPFVLVNGHYYQPTDLTNPAAFAQFYTLHSNK